MIDYRFQGRLTYLPGGPLSVNMSAWPAADTDWWVPATGSATCVAAYQAKGAASLAASYVNLVNPGTYDLTAGAAPSWDASTGWTFAAGKYLYTAHAAALNLALDFSIAVLVTHTGTANEVIVEKNGNAGFSVQNALGKLKTNLALAGAGSGEVWESVTSNDGAAYAHVFNMKATSPKVYIDAVDRTGVADTNTPNYGTNTPVYIGGRATVATFTSGTIRAIALYSTVLDETQIAEVSAAMNAL